MRRKRFKPGINEEKLRAVLRYIIALEKAGGRRLSVPRIMALLYVFEALTMLSTGRPAIGLRFIKTRTGVFSREAKKALEEVRSEN